MTSAIYGLVLSMVTCVILVALFSGHIVLLLITLVTMLGMIHQFDLSMQSCFAIVGWVTGTASISCNSFSADALILENLLS